MSEHSAEKSGLTMTTVEGLMESQTRRIDVLWRRFEETGEDRWLDAALTADRMYLRMREMAR